MKNTFKYTKLYSGANPIFEEGSIFTTVILLKKIATLKVGNSNISLGKNNNIFKNVPQNVA